MAVKELLRFDDELARRDLVLHVIGLRLRRRFATSGSLDHIGEVGKDGQVESQEVLATA